MPASTLNDSILLVVLHKYTDRSHSCVAFVGGVVATVFSRLFSGIAGGAGLVQIAEFSQ